MPARTLSRTRTRGLVEGDRAGGRKIYWKVRDVAIEDSIRRVPDTIGQEFLCSITAVALHPLPRLCPSIDECSFCNPREPRAILFDASFRPAMHYFCILFRASAPVPFVSVPSPGVCLLLGCLSCIAGSFFVSRTLRARGFFPNVPTWKDLFEQCFNFLAGQDQLYRHFVARIIQLFARIFLS